MCRVCFLETGSDEDLCPAHDGKRPSPTRVWVYAGKRCVIEATGTSDAVVRFLDRGGRATVLRTDLERAA